MRILTALSKEAEVTTDTNYAIAWIIAHTDGESIKENISQVASILDQSNKALSKQTIVHQIETSVPMLPCH